MREGIDSLPPSSPSNRAEGEEESEAAAEESPVLRRRPPSPGFVGMGEVEASFCEVSEIGEGILGGHPSEGGEADGGCMLLGCKGLEAQPAFQKVGESTDINGGSSEQVSEGEALGVVERSCSSLGGDNGVADDIGNGSEVLILGNKEDNGVSDDIGNGSEVLILGGKEDNGVPDDIGNGSEVLILGSKEVEQGCEVVVEVEEKSGIPELETEPLVESLGVDNGASVGIGNGSQLSASERKEEEEEKCQGVLGVEEECVLPVVEHGPPVEVPKAFTEDEHDDFPGLSPLRTLRGDGLGRSSGIDIGLEVGNIVGMFGNGCKDGLFETSGLAADCRLTKINGDPDKQADGFCCPPLFEECMPAYQNSDTSWVEGKCEDLLMLETEKMKSGQCNGNVLRLNECSREENHSSLKTDQNFSVESMGAKEEQTETNTCSSTEETSSRHEEAVEADRCQISLVEGAPCCLVQDLPNSLVYSSSVEGSTLEQASHVSTSVNNFSSKISLASDIKVSDVDDVNGTSTCCSNVNSSCGEADNGGSADTKSSSIIVFRRNPKRAASSRCNSTAAKSDQLNRTRISSRKYRNTGEMTTSSLCRTIKISGKVTRKRSCLPRPVRLSVWGAFDNLTKIISPGGELLKCDSDMISIQNKRTKKGRSDAGRKKRPTAQKDGSLQVLPAKFSASSSNQPIFSAMVNLQSSKKTSFDDFVKTCHNDSGISEKIGEVGCKLSGDRCSVGVNLLQSDGQHKDKDLESTLTQEVSVDTMGDCPWVSSQIGPKTLVEAVGDRHPQDPGTSPDSGVYHPIVDVGIMTSEGATSTNQDVGTGQGVTVQALLVLDCLGSAASTYSNALVTSASLPALDTQPHINATKGKENVEVNGQPRPLSEDLFVEENMHGPENLNVAQQTSSHSKSKQKKRVVSKNRQSLCPRSNRKTSRKGSKCKGFPGGSSVLGIAELECCEKSMEIQNCLEIRASSGQDVSNSQLEATILTDKSKGPKHSSNTKRVARKGRSSCLESTRRRRQNAHKQKKGNIRKTVNKCKTEEKSQTNDVSLQTSNVISSLEPDKKLASARSAEYNGENNSGSKVVLEDVSSTAVTPVGEERPLKEPQAWVLCDDCQKWRRISAALADTIGATSCRWTCKDNMDKAFADCSKPQEKTNAEINAELEISDEEDSSSKKPTFKGNELSKLAASKRASWVSIKSNLFLHRSRKTQTIDEIMVCHCQPPLDGRLGCRDECLNRMLNIECVKGTCPCADLCSNQQFQKRKYAKFKWLRCGKKGYGLQLLEDVSQGQFLIEYVGEVLDLAAYEARQRYYASRGQKHFYFMTLNGGEVIDACAKGNLGRFINHSCDPNCRTEKWMVNGEVCIGLFAVRDIKKGEEVTFDYNYVRVFGAAAKRCVCGSSECRGYIGGDPLNSDVIIQGDSDEEELEPVMVCEDGEKELDVDWAVADAIDARIVKHGEVSEQREDILIKYSSSIPHPESCVQTENSMSKPLSDVNILDVPLKCSDLVQSEDNISRPILEVQLLENSKQSLDGIQTGETTYNPVSDIQPIETSVQTSITTKESLSDSILNSKKLISNPVEKPNMPKPVLLAKSSRGTIKKGRSSVKSLVPNKTKKLAAGAGSGHFEGVEEKLNELLDEDGGISKRKDATKGYLKLLFVTAAGGDNIRGCATQSTRDLSLILDAILKTKSRMVLVDIINKNGLQMLHNIMKQNCGNFNRIPIIRKLLKVLEFLALKGILTPEHINKGPPCDGMESFKESILILTRHNDVQVHQIARNFRDKWIPRTIKRVEPSDRDSGKLDFQRSYSCWSKSSNFKPRRVEETRETDAIICVTAATHTLASSNGANIHGEVSSVKQQVSASVKQQVSASAPLTDNSSAGGTSKRKRKSRWDQPSDITSPNPHALLSTEDQTVEASPKFMKQTPAQPEVSSHSEVSKLESEAQIEGNGSFTANSMQQNADDEAPPGFGSPQKDPQIPLKIAVASSEVVMGQLQEKYLSHLPVSYGLPAALMQQLGTPSAESDNQGNPCWAIAPGMPFHPFPPLPPYPRGKPNNSSCTHASFNDKMIAQGARQERTDHTTPSTSGDGATDMAETGARNSKINGRARFSNGPGRRFICSQRFNSQRFQRWPSWPRQGNDCGFRGSMKNRTPSLGVGDVRRDISGSRFLEGVSNVNSNYHQQPDLS